MIVNLSLLSTWANRLIHDLRTHATSQMRNWDVSCSMPPKTTTTAETATACEEIHEEMTASAFGPVLLIMFKISVQRLLGLIKLDQTCKHRALCGVDLAPGHGDTWRRGSAAWPAAGSQAHHLPGSLGHSLSTMTPQPRATGRQLRASGVCREQSGR